MLSLVFGLVKRNSDDDYVPIVMPLDSVNTASLSTESLTVVEDDDVIEYFFRMAPKSDVNEEEEEDNVVIQDIQTSIDSQIGDFLLWSNQPDGLLVDYFIAS